MNNSSIFFDLDETLISTFTRQYKVIEDFCISKKLNLKYNFEEYLELRSKDRISNSDFYAHNVNTQEFDIEYKEFYLKNIESPYYLNFDKLIVNLDLLKKFKEKTKINFYILSLRSNSINSIDQLYNLGIHKYIDNFYFVKHDKIKNPKTKILKEFKGTSRIICFVGDSKTDMEASLENNIEFIKVNSNIFDFDFNGKKYNDINNFLINNLQYGEI